MKAKRKTRTPSLEAQIRESARAIHATGMQEAMRAAAYMVVAKKLDEIRAILQGVAGNPIAGNGAGRNHVPQPAFAAGEAALPAIQHPCTYCGKESVYRTRPHKFNRTGTWLCAAHRPLRVQHEQVETTRPQLVETPIDAAPVAQVVPEKKDTGGDVTVDDAFAALGVQ